MNKDAVICPCCGGRFPSFATHGRNPRPGARCPSCGALERHRLLYLFLGARTDFFRARLKVLHFAPEGCFHGGFRRLPNLDYTSADLMSPHAMERVDITRIPWPEATFDAVLCSHVLEHVPDDHRAMAEVHRVLRPGGWAILHVPIDRTRERTYEDDRIVSPEARERYFGQHDHVRWYGCDFAERLEGAGFEVTEEAFAGALDEDDAKRFGLRPGERIHLCVKPGGDDGSARPGGDDGPAGPGGDDGPARRGGNDRLAGPGASAKPDGSHGSVRALPLPLPRIVAAGEASRRGAGSPERVRAAIRRLVPSGATVLVVSRGDSELLELDGRRGAHFPQGPGGVYAGHHPADSAEAIARLENLRAMGAHYLAVPEPSFWWLEHYDGFRRHLDANGERIGANPACIVYRLGPGPG